jgi:hypothetical protein
VLDVLLERRPRAARATQQQGPVAAVEEVGVAAVAPVHVGEGPPVAGGGDPVELRTATLARSNVKSTTSRPPACRATATTAGAGRRLGAPNSVEMAALTVAPRATVSSGSGTPRLPAMANAPHQHGQAEVGGRAAIGRDSQGFPTIAAARPAMKGRDGWWSTTTKRRWRPRQQTPPAPSDASGAVLPAPWRSPPSRRRRPTGRAPRAARAQPPARARWRARGRW